MGKRICGLLLLALMFLSACRSPFPDGFPVPWPADRGPGARVSDWAFERTGEEELLGQVRGLAELGANVLHPRARTDPYEPMPHSDVSPFGINVFLNQEVEQRKREKSVQMIADAGFRWIRQEFPWEDIEIHGKGDFEDRRNDLDGDGQVDAVNAWAKYDSIVELAEQHDLRIIARLSNPPAWSRAEGDAAGTYAPPDDLADWGDYVYVVVSRYRGRVRYYQLWNEPNIYPEWGEQPVDPEGYTQLLCEGYRRAKEADPDAVIISGALAPTVALTGRDMSDFVFLQRMYDAGAAECFDILSVNDYMLWSGPTDRRMRPLNINFSRPRYIRDMMVANGDADKPIWIGEMNSNAVPNDPNIADLGAYGQVTLEQQARYAPLAYQRVMEDWPWVGVVNFWFFKRPDERERNQAMYYFRMVDPDFTPMPVYDAMKAFVADLAPALHPGTHQEYHWALDYEGVWERESVGGRYRRAAAAGATLHFAFEGASLTLVPGPGNGEIEISIDGNASRRVSLDGQPVQLVKDWRQNRHKVTLTAVSNEVSVDALIVSRPWRPSARLVLGTAGAALAFVWVFVCTLRRG